MAKRKRNGMDSALAEIGAWLGANREHFAGSMAGRAKALWALVDAGACCACCGEALDGEMGICSWREAPAHRRCVIEASLPARVNPCCYGRDGSPVGW